MPTGAKKPRGFTLVELLVVIAIIAILISILLPVLIKVRRRALVLVCPIAYIGEDGNVHITDHTGSRDLDVAKIGFEEGYKPGKTGVLVPHSAVWSPSGLRIAANSYEPWAAPPPWQHAIVISEPSTGRVWRNREETWLPFLTWIDSNSYCARGSRKIYVRDVETGAMRDSPSFYDPQVMSSQIYSFYSRSSADTGWYIAGAMMPPGNFVFQVMLLRKDLTPGKIIWQASSDPYRTWGSPKIDPSGEWVAWTHYDFSKNSHAIALKKLSAPPDMPPELLQFNHYVVFCDWTEDGNMLLNISELAPKWQLVIINKRGEIIRRLYTSIQPAQWSTATWRKYGHQ